MSTVKLIVIGGAIHDTERIHIPMPEDVELLVAMYNSKRIRLEIVLIDPAHPTIHEQEIFSNAQYNEYVTIVSNTFSNYQDSNEIPDYSIICDFTGVQDYDEFSSSHNISLERNLHLIPFGCRPDQFNYIHLIEPLVNCPHGLYSNFNHSFKKDINDMIRNSIDLKDMFEDIIPSLTGDIAQNYQILQNYLEILVHTNDNTFEYHRFNEFVSYITYYYNDPEYEITITCYKNIFKKIYNKIYVSLRDTAATISGLHTSGKILSWYQGNFNSMNGVEDKFVPILVVLMTEFCRLNRLFGCKEIDTILNEVILQNGSRNEYIKINSPFVENT